MRDCNDEQEHLFAEAPDLGQDGGGGAKAEGVSLNQFIAAAVAEKVGVMETAREFLERRARDAKPKDLLKFLRQAGREQPVESDRRYRQQNIRDLLPAGGEPSMART